MEVLLNLMGGVALLLWGIRMVRTGIMRAFGSEIRRAISATADKRITAFLAGIGVTGVLQSSTATSLIVASFAARNVIAGSVAIAILLGADVGTTLVVQLLSQRIGWISPLLFVAGVVGFLSTERNKQRSFSRALIGLGLVLLSLQLLIAASEPLRTSESLSVLLDRLGDEPVLAILIAALLTVLTHSSVAVVLLIASLATTGAVEPTMSLLLVLGANLGSAMLPVMATWRGPIVGRRAPVGNLFARVVGVIVFALLVLLTGIDANVLGPTPALIVANFHTALNLSIALVALPFVGAIDQLCQRLFPVGPVGEDEGRPRHLDEAALGSPVVALACASREALRIGDFVQQMLARTMDVLRNNDDAMRKEVEGMDDVVDRLHEATKFYLTRLTREELDQDESNRSIEILSFTTNLEHIGDIIDKNLMELAAKKSKSKASFSEAGKEELVDFHGRVVTNLELALNIFVSGDLGLARQLLQQKSSIRELERDYIEKHFVRIGDGLPESIDSSSLHLDVLRDLKRINSHLTSVAYPILERAGELADSRLLAAHEETPEEEWSLVGSSKPGVRTGGPREGVA